FIAIFGDSLVRFNKNGVILWSKGYFSSGGNPKHVLQTNDNGYVIIEEKYINTLVYPVIIRTNSQGDTIWTKTLDQIDNIPYGDLIIQTSDNNISLLCAKRINIADDDARYYKIDFNTGSIIFARTYSNPDDDKPCSIIETSDNKLLIVFKQTSSSPAFIINKIQQNGNIIWTKSYVYSINQDVTPINIKELPNGGLMMLLNHSDYLQNPTRFFVQMMRLNSIGDSLWTKNIILPTHDLIAGIGFSLSQLNDGYIFGGTSVNINSQAIVPKRMFLIYTDTSGNFINQAPHAIINPYQINYATGTVLVNYNIVDLESDTCFINAYFSRDEGITWAKATRGVGGGPTINMSGSPSQGTPYTFAWNTLADNIGTACDYYNAKFTIIPQSLPMEHGSGDTLIIPSTNNTQNHYGCDWYSTYPSQAIQYYDAQYIDTSTVYAVGNSYIVKSTNSGLTWTTVFNQATVLQSIDTIDASTLIAVGGGSTIIKTTNAGQTWNNKQSNLNGLWIYCIDMVTDSIGFAGANTGKIIKTIDGGENWFLSSLGGYGHVLDIFFLNKDTGFTTGGNSWIQKTTDGGATWSLIPIMNSFFYPSSVLFLNADTGFVVGRTISSPLAGEIYKTTDGGATWNNVYPILLDDYPAFKDITITPSGTLYITGVDGIILKSVDRGNHWQKIFLLNGYTHIFNAIDFANDRIGMTVGSTNNQTPLIYVTDPGIFLNEDNLKDSMDRISVYPNPFLESISLSTNEIIGNCILITYSATGEVIDTREINIDNKHPYSINTLEFKAGLYFIQIIDSQGSTIQHSVITKVK
ncbi:MAG: T9SS type A sorting domain-containing protein, partial [Bacteroidia bacterium]